jgi:NTP pyrophosphatase (non-canonical NTP hydrolase)
MLKEYQDKALKNLNTTIKSSKKESMRYCCMGILEETGEIVAELRKPLYKGNYHEKKMDKAAITGELGDLVWYIALACKNNGIDIENLKKSEINEDGKEDRETLIKNSMNLGKASGKIVDRYLKFSKGQIEIEKLEKSLRKQYKNILKLSSELNIPMDEILQINLNKVNSRYKDDENER